MNRRYFISGTILLVGTFFISTQYCSWFTQPWYAIRSVINISVSDKNLHFVHVFAKRAESRIGYPQQHSLNSVNSGVYDLHPSQLMALPQLQFLPSFKNPCFYVKYPPREDGGVWLNKDTVLKCWPYFQLTGVEKCGTTDLFQKLLTHHHLLKMVDNRTGRTVKEPLWYNGFMRKLRDMTVDNRKENYSCSENTKHVLSESAGHLALSAPTPWTHDLPLLRSNVHKLELHNNTLGGYLALMDNATRNIYSSCKDQISQQTGTQCPFLVSDFSARTMNHNLFWHLDEANKQFYFPKYLTADKVHHVFPQTKLLVMLRNPTERIFSDYRYYLGKRLQYNISAGDFDRRVTTAIENWNLCTVTMRVDPEKCAQGQNWTVANTALFSGFWGDRTSERLAVGIYSVFLKRWFQLFPRENIYVIKMEDYSRCPLDYIEKQILPFLGLESFRPDTRDRMAKLNTFKFNRNGKAPLSMWNSTRQKLNQFYEPYNFQLSEMLHNEAFLWRDNL